MNIFKNSLIFIFLFRIYSSQAQVVYAEISGIFTEKSNYNFAYLTFQDTKTICKAKIIDGKFIFKLIEPIEFKPCLLYLDNDSSRTYESLAQSNKSGYQSKMLAVENLKITLTNEVKYALVSGGEHTKQIDEFEKIKKTRNFESFLDSYPDSPLAISALGAFAYLRRYNEFRIKYDAKALYNKLSNRLKQSPEGKKIYLDLEL